MAEIEVDPATEFLALHLFRFKNHFDDCGCGSDRRGVYRLGQRFGIRDHLLPDHPLYTRYLRLPDLNYSYWNGIILGGGDNGKIFNALGKAEVTRDEGRGRRGDREKRRWGEKIGNRKGET